MISSGTQLFEHLTAPRSPWTVTALPEIWALARERLASRASVHVVEISGREGRTKRDLLAVAARALRFPDYFGENWDAFEECLRDLEWLPARAYVVGVSDVDQLLAESEPDRRTFFDIVETAGAFWAARAPGIAFHVVLVTTSPG
jgi:hypothetical protein